MTKSGHFVKIFCHFVIKNGQKLSFLSLFMVLREILITYYLLIYKYLCVFETFFILYFFTFFKREIGFRLYNSTAKTFI